MLQQDRISALERASVFAAKRHQLLQHCGGGTKVSRVFGTSIWDETLYKVSPDADLSCQIPTEVPP
jgi:hypothetical protein